MEKMKNSFLFVGWYPNPIDIYRNVFFQNLIFAIADQGIKCTVISPVSVTKYRSRIKKIPLHTVHYTKLGNSISVYYPRYFSASSIRIGFFNTEHISEKLFEKAAIRVAKKHIKEFDCVYGHFFLYGGLAATKIGKKYNVPAFIACGECDLQSQIFDTYGMPKKKELVGLSGIISVSSKNSRELINSGIIDKETPIITAPNAVDLTIFRKKDKNLCRKRFSFPPNAFIVGFVGGFIERKGDKRLLEAVNRIPDVYAAFAGTGDNPPTGKKVLFCGPVEHSLIPTFLNAVDVFCLPTLSEGSCNSVIESMSCGTPVISSNLPFNDDILTEENSIRINPSSTEDIENAIILLKNNKLLFEKIVFNSLRDSKALSIENRAKRIICFIKKHI